VSDGRSGPDARAGASAVEVIAALLLGLFLVHLGLETLARLRTADARLSARADALVAMRVARHVLRRELRHGEAGEDWLAASDTLALRAFRGTALVCPHDTATVEITVSYSGDRRPDPAKDSVLLMDGTGVRRMRSLEGVGAAEGSCGPAMPAPLEAWRLDRPLAPGPVIARLFERGSYHVSASALRYRVGASGRQPLTPEAWADSSGWVSAGPRLGFEAYPQRADVGPPWSIFLAWKGP
jgi:hypothetical protein